MIKKALISIDQQPYDRRHISGITFAINEKKLEEAKRRINQFRSEMSALLEVGEKTSVYQLNIQLFEISNTPFATGKKS